MLLLDALEGFVVVILDASQGVMETVCMSSPHGSPQSFLLNRFFPWVPEPLCSKWIEIAAAAKFSERVE